MQENYKEDNASNYNLNPKECAVKCNCTLIHFVGPIKVSRLKHTIYLAFVHPSNHLK